MNPTTSQFGGLRFFCVALLVLSIVRSIVAYGDDLVRVTSFFLPKGTETNDANSETTLPMAFTDLNGRFTTKPMHYQQVYAASEFSQLPISGAWLTHLGFRDNCEDVDTTSRIDIEFYLSTGLRSPDRLSPKFTDNVGFDETQVYRSTNYALGRRMQGCLFDRVGVTYPFALDCSGHRLRCRVPSWSTAIWLP